MHMTYPMNFSIGVKNGMEFIKDINRNIIMNISTNPTL